MCSAAGRDRGARDLDHEGVSAPDLAVPVELARQTADLLLRHGGYLRDLHDIGQLKLDRSFIPGLATDARARAVVASTASLARAH